VAEISQWSAGAGPAGALDRARRELGAAGDLYRDMGMTHWQERADAELGDIG
jgi:hypothetical protein